MCYRMFSFCYADFLKERQTVISTQITQNVSRIIFTEQPRNHSECFECYDCCGCIQFGVHVYTQKYVLR